MASLTQGLRSARSDGSAAGATPSALRVIVFAVGVTTISGIGQIAGISVFIDSLIRDLHISRPEISTIFSIASLAGAMTLPVTGRLIDQHGVRRMALAIAAAFGTVVLLLSQVQGLVWLALGFWGIRLLGQGALNLTGKIAIALRFHAAPGRAVGLSGALGALCMSTLAIVLSAGIEAVGWRMVWVICGIAIWACVVPLTMWALKPAGDRELSATAMRASASGVAQWSRGYAIRTAVFWVITFTIASNSLIVTGLMFHQISILGEAGLSPTRAAANYIPQTMASAITMLIVGSMADRMPRQLLLILPMTSLTLAMVVISYLDDGLITIVYGMLLGSAGATAYTAEGVLMPRYFGVRSIASIRGLVFTFNVAGAAIGPVVIAVANELTGSYALATRVLLLLPAAVVVAGLLVRSPVFPGARPGATPSEVSRAA